MPRCAYCHKISSSLTREHLLPKSVGGTLVIKACRKCNAARGNSGAYSPFLKFIHSHKKLWTAAINKSRDRAATEAYLSRWGLGPLEPSRQAPRPTQEEETRRALVAKNNYYLSRREYRKKKHTTMRKAPKPMLIFDDDSGRSLVHWRRSRNSHAELYTYFRF